jgi:hypothetical protein
MWVSQKKRPIAGPVNRVEAGQQMNDTTIFTIPEHVHKILIVQEIRSKGIFFRLRFMDSEGEGTDHRFPATQAQSLADELNRLGFNGQSVGGFPKARLFIR